MSWTNCGRQSSKKSGNKSSLALIAALYRFEEDGCGFGAQAIPAVEANQDDGCNNSLAIG